MKKTLNNLTKMAFCAFALAACDTPPNGTGTTVGRTDGSPSDPSSVAYFQQTVGDRVLFAVDQSTLGPDAIAVLNGQANWLLQYTQHNVTIEGHADEQGTREYNLALGARRASAVQNYLVSRGIADNRIRTITFGKERPIEICSTEACWSQNRRAVTVVGTGLGS